MAMEPFVPFQEYLIAAEGNLLWPMSPELLHFDCATAFPGCMTEFDPPPPTPPQARGSAFRRYARPDAAQMMECSSSAGGGGGRNMHLLIVGMLRRIQKPEERRGGGGGGVETSRGFRHMMRERQRREKLSQSYADLYSIVASRSKNDKNSIVQTATQYVRELKGIKEALRQRNEELRARILGGHEETKVKIRMANPSSPVESMIGALRCLQGMDVKARAIRSDLSHSNFSAIMSIDAEQMAAADVERAVEEALMETEKKLRCQLPGINAWS